MNHLELQDAWQWVPCTSCGDKVWFNRSNDTHTVAVRDDFPKTDAFCADCSSVDARFSLCMDCYQNLAESFGEGHVH